MPTICRSTTPTAAEVATTTSGKKATTIADGQTAFADLTITNIADHQTGMAMARSESRRHKTNNKVASYSANRPPIIATITATTAMTLFGGVMAMLLLSAAATPAPGPTTGPLVANASSCDRCKKAETVVAAADAATLGVNNVQRHAHRSAIADDDYSSSLHKAIEGDSKAGRYGGQHLAALGIRTRRKPQQFYAKTPQPATTTASAAVDGNLRSLNLVHGAREDICKEHCSCARTKSAFVTIACDFQKNRDLSWVFGSNFKVPHDATALTIKLAVNTRFVLVRGFFTNNTINSLTIEGTYSVGEQVEITTEAFHENIGPYPEIYMTNVFSVIVREGAFSADGKFTVRNSNDLILLEDAFVNAKINGLFVGINDLRISEKAFNSSQAKLRIESSNIDNIYRFEASLREIRFVNCTIGNINGGTFDVIHINSIVFDGCRINSIKARAITEKLYSDHLSITGAIIGSIESEAIYGSGIAELILTKNRIETIHENAIHVTALNATISRNNVTHLGNNWLRIKDWSNIVVERNKFGTFGRMHLEETKEPVTCRFERNSLTKPLPGSLNITNSYCVLREISVDLPCRCNLNWLLELSAHDLRSETYCTIDDKLGHCFNASSFNTLKYVNEVCDESKTTLDCVANMNLEKVDGHFFTPEELERRDRRVPQLLLILGGIVLLLAAITMAVIVVICHCRKRRGAISSHQSPGGGASSPSMGDHQHEFSDDDRHIIDQTLQLIQKKYPEIYKQVNDRVQTLLQSDLPTKKCVKAIIHLHIQLNKVDAGADFNAFNGVLTQHLQPQMPTAPPAEPIYSEPRLGGDGDGFYTSGTIVGVPNEVNLSQGAPPPSHQPATGGGHRGNGPEHIYAEPNCAQQPLLGNEYASPADRNIDSMDLYTEPINERDVTSVAAAYAVTTTQPRPLQYAMPMAKQPARLPPAAAFTQPSHSGAHNLPDVLFQSRPSQTASTPPPPPSASTSSSSSSSAGSNSSHSRALTNVQKIAQNLQSMPKFQPIQPPSGAQRPRHLHLVAPPVYTAPDFSRKHQPPLPRPNAEARLASPEFIDELELDMRGAMALPPDSGSDHSGGSNETVKIDDVIDYADA